MKNIDSSSGGSENITIVLGQHKFELEKSFLFADNLRVDERQIKDIAHVDYFSFDFLFPERIPVTPDAAQIPGWNNRVSVYLSKERPFDFRARVSKSDMFPVDVEKEFNSPQLIKFEERVLREKESSGDRNVYIHGDYEIYMSCDSGHAPVTPKYPSCKLITEYEGMEVSATFSSELKFRFVEIKNVIFELLEKFIIKGE